ncbi:MAG: hypothetical protein K2O42_09780 [Oscillospiraceae bacterium]|nr:hypothetical protein [Oscillospiraceae bacterium]
MADYQLVAKFHTQQNGELPVIQTVSFGSGKKYFILKDRKPYLMAEADAVSNFFDKACIFGKYLCIGTGDTVIFVNLETLGSISMQVNFYFGYFFIYENMLYIASGTGITAVNASIQTVWKNEGLAIDGVIIHEVCKKENREYLRISCEMDPPGGWVEKHVNLTNGEILL